MKYLGLGYTTKNKAFNKQLQETGNAYFVTGATNYYFTNPIVALSVKHYLSKHNNNFKYHIQEIPEEIIKKKTYIKRFDDFLNIINKSNTKYSQTNNSEIEK